MPTDQTRADDLPRSMPTLSSIGLFLWGGQKNEPYQNLPYVSVMRGILLLSLKFEF